MDWRTEREPSCDDIVFWRETGINDDDDDVEAREGACSMETAMAGVAGGSGGLGCEPEREREGMLRR